MKTRAVTALLALLLVGAWAMVAKPTESAGPVTQAAATPAAARTPFAGGPLISDRGTLFSGAGQCASCHTAMKDGAGTDVSVDADWRATMMANSIRDPYHLAEVRAELLNNPALQAVIEDTCSRCHTPMAQITVAAKGDKGKYFGNGFLNGSNALHGLAMDGISCTVCHQIQSAGLGQRSTFDGHYAVDKETPAGRRILFGQFVVAEAANGMMQAVSGFTTAQGKQMTQSELCASCHTLYTPFVDGKGQVVGEFPEQMPYLEWQNSSYNGKSTCQNCHMPQAQGGVVLSATGGEPRSPFGRHTFASGNTYMLGLLNKFGAELGLTTSSAQLQSNIDRMTEYYQENTATIALEGVRRDGTRLGFDVIVKSLAGHKFPTGFPSRRVWLHVTVRGADGKVVFESGAVRPDGQILGNDNDANAGAFEPHYAEIRSADQVQIYEAIMRNTDGKVTTTLLRAAAYAKDNRLLPAGFDKTKAAADIAVHGSAVQDADFAGGGDVVHYAVEVAAAQEPLTVTAELLYQSIGHRWAQNLRAYDAVETKRFSEYYDQVPNVPVRIASSEARTAAGAPAASATVVRAVAPTPVPTAMPAASAESPQANVEAVLPAGAGKELVLTNCTVCHSLRPIVTGKKDLPRWEGIRPRMRAAVAALSDDKFNVLWTYLEQNFDDKKPEPVLPPGYP